MARCAGARSRLDSKVVAIGHAAAQQTAMDGPLPEQLARLHNNFERVHPFIDGNGRTGDLPST